MRIPHSIYNIWSLLITLALLFYFSSPARAQLVEGQNAIDFGGGKSDIGLIAGGGYVHYLPGRFSIRGGAWYETGNPYQFNYRNIGFDALIRYNLFNIYNIVYVNPYAGATVNYDHISPVKSEFNSSLNGGLKLGLEAEALLNEKFSFIAFFSQQLLLRRDFGNQRYDYGLGVRLYIGN